MDTNSDPCDDEGYACVFVFEAGQTKKQILVQGQPGGFGDFDPTLQNFGEQIGIISHRVYPGTRFGCDSSDPAFTPTSVKLPSMNTRLLVDNDFGLHFLHPTRSLEVIEGDELTRRDDSYEQIFLVPFQPEAAARDDTCGLLAPSEVSRSRLGYLSTTRTICETFTDGSADLRLFFVGQQPQLGSPLARLRAGDFLGYNRSGVIFSPDVEVDIADTPPAKSLFQNPTLCGAAAASQPLLWLIFFNRVAGQPQVLWQCPSRNTFYVSQFNSTDNTLGAQVHQFPLPAEFTGTTFAIKAATYSANRDAIALLLTVSSSPANWIVEFAAGTGDFLGTQPVSLTSGTACNTGSNVALDGLAFSEKLGIYVVALGGTLVGASGSVLGMQQTSCLRMPNFDELAVSEETSARRIMDLQLFEAAEGEVLAMGLICQSNLEGATVALEPLVGCSEDILAINDAVASPQCPLLGSNNPFTSVPFSGGRFVSEGVGGGGRTGRKEC